MTTQNEAAKPIAPIPDYVKGNRVPLAHETILSNNQLFQPTNKDYRRTRIYRNIENDWLYYIDRGHPGQSAHLEVFDKRGKIHIGEADPITGKLIPNSADSNKKPIL